MLNQSFKKKKKNTERKMIINIPDWWKRFD